MPMGCYSRAVMPVMSKICRSLTLGQVRTIYNYVCLFGEPQVGKEQASQQAEQSCVGGRSMGTYRQHS